MRNSKAICEFDIFEELIKEDKSIIYKILDEFYDIVIDKDLESVHKLIEENPIAKYFLKRENATLLSDNGEFKKIGKEEYSNFLNDIVLLPEDKDTEAIRTEYGVMAIHLNDKCLVDNNSNIGYSFNITGGSTFSNWEDLILVKKVEIVNSAIIIDNYLWDKFENFKEDNEENLYPLLASIIPKSLKIPFHLIFVIQNSKSKFTPEKAKEKLKKVKRDLERITGVTIELGLISQTDTKVFHKRVILTNHHYIISDKGFTIFKRGKVTNNTEGTRNWVFKDILNYIGEIDKHKHINTINDLKDLIKINKERGTDVIFNEGNMDNPLLN